MIKSKLLDDISQAQQERLFHIDFKLRFLGTVNRNDLVNRFGIKAAAATRDISLYKELAPKNLIYDTKAKAYIEADTFNPLFNHQASQTLAALCYGLGDDHVSVNTPLVSSETPTQLNFPNLDVLAKVTKAIHQSKALNIYYRSLSSGLSQRDIVPFALVDNGLRWHVRAFDRKRKQFKDFVLNRIEKPKLLSSPIETRETKEEDIQWNRMVEMHIVPHPNLKHPETIEAEYAMIEGVLRVQIRAAVAGYVLRRWNVDCSKKHTLMGPEFQLWLKNTQTLYGVENLAIAPGYQELQD
ncbi:WYL domain-containing protein [Vibrio mytili]|uniref:WYL domain-containing protein n=1 Tax=Gammaproteobacteria TaxID=1236 RepID=UPI00201E6C38|nr:MULTISPECIES: WYL domain-containing protein [unclassified Pseudoalteromonas]MDN3489332.1 WYL domain-containing protein [Pseudoalteromonas sp. APC 3694]